VEGIKDKRHQTILLTDKYLTNTFSDLFGNVANNDKKWKLMKFGECLEKIESGESPVCEGTPRPNDSHQGVLKLSAVTYGIFNPKENKLFQGTLNKTIVVNKGDLLFTRKNTKDLVGATAYVFDNQKNLLLPDLIFKLNLKKNIVLPQYIWKLFLDKGFKGKVTSLSSGSAGSMPNISKEKLRNLMIPVPKILIQHKFANITNMTEKLKVNQIKSKEEIEILFDSLMKKAFRGELDV
jgi:type I restriction enzyme S subunit